jgi:murein DD-endopeptidase MepM/ murein hydrolase activator NlpD
VDRARIVRSERRIAGVINSSLVDAARGVELPYDLVDDFVDLFSNRVEFRRDLQPGDTFSVIYDDQQTDDGERIGGATIKAASLRLSGKLYAVVRDEAPDGTVRYFDENGEMPGKFFLRYPVQYTRISSVFSNARFHPVLNVSRPHNGVDFSAPTGTPVRTVGEGLVTFSGFTKSTGYIVRIQHDSRYSTEYMHLSEIEARVKKGSKVRRGELIGAVGSTGLSTGPHLHFGMFDAGRYIDPLKAKVMLQPDEVKPPKAVLVMLEHIKKSHEVIRVAEVTPGNNV